jgi:hypothetical protein
MAAVTNVWLFYDTSHPTRADEAAVRRLGLKIDAFSGDEILDYPRIGTNYACTGGRCVFYWRHCERDTHHCRFDTADPIDKKDLRLDVAVSVMSDFEITAHSARILSYAIEHVKLAIGRHPMRDDVLLPVAELSEETGARPQGGCPHLMRLQGCGQPWLVLKNQLLHSN